MSRRLPALAAPLSSQTRALRALSLGALALALAACAPMPQTGAPLPPATTTCDAASAAWAVGQDASADVVERVRVDSHSASARVLHPGQIITMEFSAQRVNVKVDADNAIVAVTCG